MPSYTHFTLCERENLRELASKDISIREIARRLGRSPSSVSRELKRGNTKHGYNAWWSTSMYIFRRKRCVRRKRLATDEQLIAFVKGCLEKYWSPEIITVKWKETHPGAKLSHCTIYRALKTGLLPEYPADKYLRRHNNLKYKRGNNQTIKPQHVIEERPDAANMRERIGDWEGDTVYGAVGRGALVTCVDRKERYLVAAIAKNMQAPTVRDAMYVALQGKPMNSLTLDRGSEFAAFREMEETLGCPIYFANPHSPWERGSNENINGLIRFFFPKGSDFTKLEQHELDVIVELINSRPRKCLGWLSPKDIFFAKCCN